MATSSAADPLASNARTWSANDVPVEPFVTPWLQDGLLELEIAKAEAAVFLDKRLETARSGGRR